MLWQLFWSFFKIGAFTFGSGYAMIPMIEKEVVDRKKWFGSEDFYNHLALAQSSPGPIALNTAVFVGYRQKGWIGALTAVLGTVIPCFTIILVIAMFLGDMSIGVISLLSFVVAHCVHQRTLAERLVSPEVLRRRMYLTPRKRLDHRDDKFAGSGRCLGMAVARDNLSLPACSADEGRGADHIVAPGRDPLLVDAVAAGRQRLARRSIYGICRHDYRPVVVLHRPDAPVESECLCPGFAEFHNLVFHRASAGCVRLCVRDVKWIYDHCASGTIVTLYDDSNLQEPLMKPNAIRIPTNSRNAGWDPTDPDGRNPW